MNDCGKIELLLFTTIEKEGVQLKKIYVNVFIILIIGVLMMGALALLNIREYNSEEIKTMTGEEIVLLNELSKSCSNFWWEEDGFQKHMINFVQGECAHSFCIMDMQEKIRFSYGDINISTLNEAYKNHCLIGDIWVDDKLVGKIILEDYVYKNLSAYKQKLYSIIYIFLSFTLVVEIAFVIYFKKKIIEPFYKLKEFATQIAQGNLDIPLEQERSNLFGAFTESFDIMREELLSSQRREAIERQKREELAISLNHDIKAPISAIKAIAELLSLKISKNKVTKEELQKKIGEINTKATQTNMLVNNMLNVSIGQGYDASAHMDYYYTEEVLTVLERADYQDKICFVQFENCLVKADIVKLTQVFDNCITNSYKYADTPIHIYGKVEMGGKFSITIKDEGNTLCANEIENLCIKYYRGSNSVKKDGSGLGLHVSKMMMECMDGTLTCQQEADGFCVKLYLPM